MFDLTLIKELTEVMGSSLNFADIEEIGSYLFKNYNTHKLEKMDHSMTISAAKAAKRLVNEAQDAGKLKELFLFVVELDQTQLNGRRVNLKGLENLLYKLSCTGIFYDFQRRRLTNFHQDKKNLLNWGALKEGKEYPMTVMSLDICQNSELVKKYKSKVMEKVYYRFWEYLNPIIATYEGRIWNWAGDGGIIAFRTPKEKDSAVLAGLEILLALPVFNMEKQNPIDDPLCLRVGLDAGMVKFADDTGRIVSDVINYAAHLEKKGTPSNGLSLSDDVYQQITPKIQSRFQSSFDFENRKAWSLEFDMESALKS